MHRNYLRISQKILKRTKAFRSLDSSSRRIAKQYLETEISRHLLHKLTHMTDTHDTESTIIQLDGLTSSHTIESREHILHHTTGIASLSIIHLNTMTCAIIKIDMVSTNGSRSNHLDLSPLKESSITTGTRTDDHSIRIYYISVRNLPSIYVHNFRIRLKYTLEERHLAIYNNLHI